MRDVYVIGVNMTKFGKHHDRNNKSLASEAVEGALTHAGISKADIQGAISSNCMWGLIDGQASIRGQVVLRAMGIDSIPIINVENACASGTTAFHVAYSMIALGSYDVALAFGMEKMISDDPQKMLQNFIAGTDVEETKKIMEKVVEDKGRSRAIFMDLYATAAKKHMSKYGTTQRQLAVVSSKNHFHSTMNPYAMYRRQFSVEEVLQASEVVFPLTQPMCSPMSDGAAAAILCSADYLKKLNSPKPIKILASVLGSGRDRTEEEESVDSRVARRAYEMAGISPKDINVVEVHDATSYAEISVIEALGLCPEGEGGPFAESGATRIGGKVPVNTSGGLESKGHPLGATGLGQIAEVVWQLRGEAGDRQVEGAKTGLIENGGGVIIKGPLEAAALTIHILQK